MATLFYWSFLFMPSMTKGQQISLVLLRLGLGWFMFYAGVTKVLDPMWSAAGYLKGAKTFVGFYDLLLSPSLLPFINFLNAWGLLLIGLSLMCGVFVRIGALSGALLMLLYYFPVLDFPYPNTHTFLVDEHIIYAITFVLLASFRAGRFWGLESWCSTLPICAKFPQLRGWLG